MDSSVNSLLVAQYMQGKIAEATSARSVREAKLARERKPQLRHVRRLLGRRAPAEPATPAAAGTVTVVPPC